jgi:hypothetical protein
LTEARNIEGCAYTKATKTVGTKAFAGTKVTKTVGTMAFAYTT